MAILMMLVTFAVLSAVAIAAYGWVSRILWAIPSWCVFVWALLMQVAHLGEGGQEAADTATTVFLWFCGLTAAIHLVRAASRPGSRRSHERPSWPAVPDTDLRAARRARRSQRHQFLGVSPPAAHSSG